MKDKQKFKLIIYGVIALLIFLVSLTFALGYLMRPPVETYLITQELENYVTENKLEIGFYGSPYNVSLLDEQTELIFFEKLFKSDWRTFSKYYTENYFYEKNSYDCKYWAFVWAYYYYKNYDSFEEKNIQFQYVQTENHIFVLLSNLKGYCLIDSGAINCFGDIGKW